MPQSSTAGRTRRRISRPGARPSVPGRVRALVEANASLTSQNAQLHAQLEHVKGVLAEIEQALVINGAAVVRATRGITSPSRPRTLDRKRRKVGRVRAAITDPVTLEKRRAALTKARKVLAAKRAAAKK